MPTNRMQIGLCFDRTFPPQLVTELARALDRGGAGQLWVIEDCFYTAGVSLAASALTVTEQLEVGIGILPAVARNPAVTAMEFATLDGLAPGRLLPGIGHGVQTWMAQMGARPASPLTSLEEVLVAVGRLLAGENVTTHGHYVDLDGVQLDQPPASPPPLLAGVRGPRSLAMAGRVAGGVVLAEPAGPAYVRWALEQAGRRPDDFHVATFGVLCVQRDREEAYRIMAPWLARVLDEATTAITAVPFYDDLAARYAEKGLDGLVSMPPQWWTELAPIGTMDDAFEHVDALERAGVRSVGLYPSPDVEVARGQVADIVALAAR
ncbi:alkanesulfonate monooxygenase SsuD/methylene tetrahydromethanopterin reductase-like flavin-dependent oxidoreductase (luciferase family) [Haloactinopolyspora alba]|uniref:Alkanesulfonate monooxygenase SsuD/methylene tetrahydromethanopterin reductase-like flavin-dependent oxidoreductase (Luciferase family) n=1 Tax=Haloactinopolyspora alba TaxID=648780 RepID=A0A2P8E1D0_9ACTN|nr:LLM class flavin-dependent oxidoreductase [Haloactinopolyspora alba]PSL03207.1 alkanesulfonate monooxygenase SsuD/methylene tetrahydromethanopterin reductase-like flavin-dependent oxidoreductase (luciferase family) [Haloactinopolyspora alba]